MHISRPCYDKPHRCPGWAGGGWKSAKIQTCDNGAIVLWKIDDPVRKWFSPYDWRMGHCSTCGIYTIPFALRRLDPRWWWGFYAWRVKYWIEDKYKSNKGYIKLVSWTLAFIISSVIWLAVVALAVWVT